MSSILLPLIAVGGIYLAVNTFTRKNKKHPSSSTRTTTTSTDSYDTEKTSSTDTYHYKRKPEKSRNLFSLREGNRKTRKQTDSKKLFVFYSFGEKNKDWEYKNIPDGWKMKRRILSVNSTSYYNNVDVFKGESKYIQQMRDYLEKIFSQLKENRIVKEYKVRGINTPL